VLREQVDDECVGSNELTAHWQGAPQSAGQSIGLAKTASGMAGPPRIARKLIFGTELAPP
jgi:hypothetical protein